MNIEHLNNTAGIYFIVNKLSGKVYVGMTKDLRKRAIGHRSALERGIHNNIPLQEDWVSLGKDNFEFVVLEKEDNIENRKNKEKQLIKEFSNNYNIEHGNNPKKGLLKPKKIISSRVDNYPKWLQE